MVKYRCLAARSRHADLLRARSRTAEFRGLCLAEHRRRRERGDVKTDGKPHG